MTPSVLGYSALNFIISVLPGFVKLMSFKKGRGKRPRVKIEVLVSRFYKCTQIKWIPFYSFEFPNILFQIDFLSHLGIWFLFSWYFLHSIQFPRLLHFFFGQEQLVSFILLSFLSYFIRLTCIFPSQTTNLFWRTKRPWTKSVCKCGRSWLSAWLCLILFCLICLDLVKL